MRRPATVAGASGGRWTSCWASSLGSWGAAYVAECGCESAAACGGAPAGPRADWTAPAVVGGSKGTARSRGVGVGGALGGAILRELAAGVAVSLNTIPTAVAFAFIGGFEPRAGLTGTWIVGLVMALLGGRPGEPGLSVVTSWGPASPAGWRGSPVSFRLPPV